MRRGSWHFRAHGYAARCMESPGRTGCHVDRRAAAERVTNRRRKRRTQPARYQLPARIPGHRPRGLGGANARAGPISWPRSGSTFRCAALPCSSKRASIAARSGWSSSRTTSRSGRRSASTSARSCTTCFARAHSRARRRASLLRQVRQRNDDPERHQSGHRQHRGRLRAPQAGRVRDHQDPTDGRPDRDVRRKAMAQFSVNAQRFDPYKNFKFRVKWDGRYVAGVSKVGALKRTTEVVEHREGGDPSTSRKSPAGPSTRPSPWSAASLTTPSSKVGEQGLELRLRPGRGSLAQRFSQGHHHRGLQRGRPAGPRL